MLQSCKFDLNKVFLPKLTAQEGPFYFLFVTKHLLCLSFTTRDNDDGINANEDLIKKEDPPPPSPIRHDLLGFFISVFDPHHPRQDDGEKLHRWRTRRVGGWGKKQKHSAMATALKAP